MGRARQRKKDREAAPRPPVERRSRGAAGGGERSPAVLGGALLVAFVGLAVYANSFSVPFLFDDHFAIVGNPEIRSLEPLTRFFTRSRGLPHLLDTLNYRWGGESVWGYHLVNVAVHVVNALLVYALALLTLRLPVHGGRYESRAPLLASLTALIFAVHPLQNLAVSYIVQRAESVAAMFYLLAVIVFAAGRSGRIGLRGSGLAAVVLTIGFLGIISKETVASLPAVLLLYHLCFLRGQGENEAGGWRLALLLGLPGLYGVYLARHFLLPGFGDAEGGQSAWMFIPSAGMDVEGVTPWRYLITQFGVIVWYLRLFVLPTHLTFDYGWPLADSFWSLAVLAPLTVLTALLAAGIGCYWRYRWVTFAVGWLFLTLAPSSSIIPIKDAAFEYRMYLPTAGLAMLVVVAVADLLRRIAGSRDQLRGAERIAVAIAALWITALAVGNVVRNQTLRDPLALARDSATKAPNHWRNHFALGAALLENGKSGEAIESFERAIELNPDQSTSRIMLSDLYSRAGRLDEAEEVVLPATDTREESVSAAAYRQLGFIYKAKSYPEAAVGMFEEALARQPKWRALDLQIVRLLRHSGRFHDAAVRLNRLVGVEPSYADQLGVELAETNLRGGVQSFQVGEPEFARHMLSVAMENPATLAAAAHYLAYVESRSGHPERAVELLADLERRGLASPAVLANLERARAGLELVEPRD